MHPLRPTSCVITGAIAGILLVTGCNNSVPSDSPQKSGNNNSITTAELTLTDDYRIVSRQNGADPGDWLFTIEGTSESPNPSWRYAWQFGGGRLFEGLQQNYTFGSTGIYPVRVQVETADGSVLFTLQTIVEVIIPGVPNMPPTADAGPDLVVDEGATATLDGSASRDVDSFALAYQWRQTAGDPFAVLTNAAQPVATFVAPMVSADTSIEFTLSVNSDEGQFSIDKALVLVRNTEDDALDPASLPPDPIPGGGVDDGGVDDGGSGGGSGGGDTGESGTDGGSGGGDTGGGDTTGGGTGLTENLPHIVIVASDENDLQTASHLSGTNNITVLVANDITVNESIPFNFESIVRILGIGDHPTIDFNMDFNGDWNDPRNFGNGIRFSNRQGVLRNVRVTGYERIGSAIKGHVTELLDVSDCAFENAGQVVHPYRVVPPQDASDAVLGMMIGGHNLDNAHLNVASCQFWRCSSNNQRWTHCIYTSGRSISVTDNTFSETGNPFSIGSNSPVAANAITGNVVQDPVAGPLPNGTHRPAYLAGLDPDEYTIYMYNIVSGQYFAPWTGSPNTAKHYMGQNDYTDMTYSGVWASDVVNGVQIPWDDWQALGFDTGPDQTPPSTVTVRTEAELRSAAARTATESLNILVDAPIVLTQSLIFPNSSSVVRLLGIGDHPAITFQMPFNGDYTHSDAYAINGIELNCRSAMIRNITFRDFNLMGAAIMGRAAELFHISDCVFSRCGNVSFAPRISPPLAPSDVIHTLCVAAEANIDAHVSVTGCTFDQCATNQWEWSRCLSLGGRSVSVMDNIFTRCGTPFDVGGRYIAEGNHIFGNAISQPSTAPNAAGQQIAPRLLDLHDDDHTAFSFNTISGQFHQPWGYTSEIGNHYVGQNDYANMTHTGAWATNFNTNSSMTVAEWQAIGFDQ